jgi:hypothetical protein
MIAPNLKRLLFNFNEKKRKKPSKKYVINWFNEHKNNSDEYLADQAEQMLGLERSGSDAAMQFIKKFRGKI